MHVIALASRKGGSGKTTLTAHLAVAAEAAGVGQTAIIDTDPQGGLAGWWNARERHEPKGWCCLTCHPPVHLRPDQIRREGEARQPIHDPPAGPDPGRCAHPVRHPDRAGRPSPCPPSPAA
jgi:hypothetical protein